MKNATKSSVRMFFGLLKDNQEFPEWAINEFHTETQDAIVANQVYFTSENKNMAISGTSTTGDEKIDVSSLWPLRTSLENSYAGGITVSGVFDATNFTESSDISKDENYDLITFIISNFETDSPTTSAIGVQNFQLRPCEELHISLTLEHRTLLDRPNSHCRDDYPPELKKLLDLPMTPGRLFNSIFAPDLPYDKVTCDKLCAAKYWLPKWNCFIDSEIWNYAGQPKNISICANSHYINLSSVETPAAAFVDCKCYQKCDSYQLRIAGNNKIRYSYG